MEEESDFKKIKQLLEGLFMKEQLISNKGLKKLI